MIDYTVTLTPSGGVCCGVRLGAGAGLHQNRGVYRLAVTASGEWEGWLSAASGTSRTTKTRPSSLVVDGYVSVPASVTAQPGSGCVTFEGSDGTKTVTVGAADVTDLENGIALSTSVILRTPRSAPTSTR